ncbi:MAG: DUF4038 domain-containing protein [Acidobacteria bacterium]|nr:DUF4038 domain-containing protein [Acidobacteriota bacterium]
MRLLAALALALAPTMFAEGVPTCPATPAYSLCDLVFEMNDQDAAAHPNPYLTVKLHAEFRSPRHRTFLMPAFWTGGRKLVIRFAPDEPGDWAFRLTSNIDRFNDKEGAFQSTPSEVPGYVRPANLHHWATLRGENVNMRKQHLWMGDTCLRFAFLTDAEFRQVADTRAAQHFTHLRGLLIGGAADSPAVYADADHPAFDYFQRVDDRIRYLNSKGIVADLIVAGKQNHLTRLFPNWDQRQRYIRYIVARYSAMNVTWQGIEEFESYDNGRELLKEIGTLLKQNDPYLHPRSTDTRATSAALAGDGWMNFITHGSGDDQIGAIEHQLYPAAFVNLQFARENSGAGARTPADVGTDEFRRRLWNSTMNGQYPTYSNTGTAGGAGERFDARQLTSAGAQQMAHWFEFMDDTRHWELEPWFDVDGARAIALEGVEYIVYVDKPGPIEVGVEKHGYDVSWFNPISGETIPLKKWKGERWTGQPPDSAHDWVLHIEREGRKESMLNSYKFDSREYPLEMQTPETAPLKTPFDIAEPADLTVSVSKPAAFAVKLKRETRGTRSMMYLWTAEAPSQGRGFRVVGTGPKGTWSIPAGVAGELPAVVSLRLAGMNALGKVYLIDKVLKLVP